LNIFKLTLWFLPEHTNTHIRFHCHKVTQPYSMHGYKSQWIWAGVTMLPWSM